MRKVIPFLCMVIVCAGLLYLSRPSLPKLPILGEPNIITRKLANGTFVQDTLPHTIPSFSFIDQKGKTVTKDDFNDCVYVTDFFFVKCMGICPIMTSQMKRVYEAYLDNTHIKFLSHTVNPENDNIAALNEYAKKQKADSNKWHFVTGNKMELYSIARNGYLLSATQGNGDYEDFIHTQNFALIDPDKRIRGYYDGTDSIEIRKLISDINRLLDEYDLN